MRNAVGSAAIVAVVTLIVILVMVMAGHTIPDSLNMFLRELGAGLAAALYVRRTGRTP
jgi:hypothetical protein